MFYLVQGRLRLGWRERNDEHEFNSSSTEDVRAVRQAPK
jgi:hypothetical protein